MSEHLPVPVTRREFLSNSGKSASLLAFGRLVPAFLAATACKSPRPERDRSILVLVQLIGGNDGLNSLVPFENDLYYKARPNLGIAKRAVHRVFDGQGFHPALSAFRQLLDEGALGIIQGVGYPNPNRSHFRSAEIWETASESDEFLSSGWIGRYFSTQDHNPADPGDPSAVHLSEQLPDTYLSEAPFNTCGIANLPVARHRNAAPDQYAADLLDLKTASSSGNFDFLKRTMMNASISRQRLIKLIQDNRPEVDYPDYELARSFQSIAALIASGLPTRTYFVSLEGFDTHEGQLGTHHKLLEVLSKSMLAFQLDLDHRGLSDQVLTMTFSEFGRGLHENSSQGTDHGTAAPLFVMGSQVKGGLYGKTPTLPRDPTEGLEHQVDFRRVYATIMDQWLQWPSEDILGQSFRNLSFIA